MPAALDALPGSRPRLVAIDVDHTLIREDRTLADATIEAVAAARAAGIEVVLASSRPAIGMRRFLLALDLVAPVRFVACQGGWVGTVDAGGELHALEQHPMEKAQALRAVDAARAHGASINWYAGERWVVEAMDARIQRESDNARVVPEVGTFDEADAPEKLLLISDGLDQTLALGEALRPGLDAETSNPRYLEVTRLEVGKATGVASIAAAAGIDPADAVGIGDGRNDLGLFAWAGRSIAPANAHPDVLAAADVVAPRNDDDGVAHALDALRALPVG